MFQIRNEHLDDDPTIFLLSYQYWLHASLADVDPDARDGLLLAHLHALTWMLGDERRTVVQKPISEWLAELTQGADYVQPPNVGIVYVSPEDARLAKPGDKLTLVYSANFVPATGGNLVLEALSPAGDVMSPSPALMYPGSVPIAPTGGFSRTGTVTIERGSEPLEQGSWRMALTLTTFMGGEVYVPFTVADSAGEATTEPTSEATPEPTSEPTTESTIEPTNEAA